MIKWVKWAVVVLLELVMSPSLFLAEWLRAMFLLLLLLLCGGRRVATEADVAVAVEDEEDEEGPEGRVGDLFVRADVVPGVTLATAREVGATLLSLPVLTFLVS